MNARRICQGEQMARVARQYHGLMMTRQAGEWRASVAILSLDNVGALTRQQRTADGDSLALHNRVAIDKQPDLQWQI